MTKNKHKPTRPTKAPHPYCKECGYNLTGVPLPIPNLYTCPECGGFTNAKTASHLPWYIGPTKLPLIITTIPPSMIIAAITGQSIPEYLDPITLAIVAALTLSWFAMVALVIAFKVARYKGPNQWSGPSTTFTKITLQSIFWFPPVFAATWITLAAVQLGAFQI